MSALSVELREVTWRAPAQGPAVWQATPERRGVVVRVRDADGFAGVGEASPLPVEAVPDVRKSDEWAATREALQRWRGMAGDVRNADEAFAAARAACGDVAAARFAVETALCDLLAARRGVTFAELLAAQPAASVPINAVCDPGDAESAQHALARGIRTLKLKLGDQADELRGLHGLRALLGRDLQLRGDANRAWSLAQAPTRLEQLAGFEYVEEPCRELDALLQQAPRATWPPLAVDESAVGASDEQIARWMQHPQIAALILKPTRLGLATCLRWAQLASAAGKATVVTHALEGPVAMAAGAELARAIAPTQPDIAVGLDAHPGLDAWPVRAPQLFANEVRAVKSAGLGLAAQWDRLIPTSAP